MCIVDTQGKIVKEAKVASDPEDLIAFFASLGFAVNGLEAGPLSQWLQSGLKCAGLEVVPAGDATRKGGVVGNDCEDRP